MNEQLWVIDAREPDGALDFRTLQAHHIFGLDAITGITEDAMAKVIYRYDPIAPPLDGRDIEHWPTRLHPKWVARRKTW